MTGYPLSHIDLAVELDQNQSENFMLFWGNLQLQPSDAQLHSIRPKALRVGGEIAGLDMTRNSKRLLSRYPVLSSSTREHETLVNDSLVKTDIS